MLRKNFILQQNKLSPSRVLTNAIPLKVSRSPDAPYRVDFIIMFFSYTKLDGFTSFAKPVLLSLMPDYGRCCNATVLKY